MFGDNFVFATNLSYLITYFKVRLGSPKDAPKICSSGCWPSRPSEPIKTRLEIRYPEISTTPWAQRASSDSQRKSSFPLVRNLILSQNLASDAPFCENKYGRPQFYGARNNNTKYLWGGKRKGVEKIRAGYRLRLFNTPFSTIRSFTNLLHKFNHK